MIAVNVGGKFKTTAPHGALDKFLTLTLAGGPRTGPPSGSMFVVDFNPKTIGLTSFRLHDELTAQRVQTKWLQHHTKFQ